MKKIILIISLVFIPLLSFAQSEYVSADNPVYNFLERMETLKIISNYNSFQIPKTRNEISRFIEEVIDNQNKLDEIDKKILDDFKIEFEFELNGSLLQSQSIIGKGEYNPISQKQKYLFSYTDPEKMNLFINLLGEGQLLSLNDRENKLNQSAALGIIGGKVRGTVLDKIGFEIYGTNGILKGNKNAALIRNDLKYNYKLNQTDTSKFFDESYGYLDADFNIVKLKIGRDRMNIGYGPVKPILDNNAPLFDYLGFNIDYKFFNFSYFHGKLLGPESIISDPVTGTTAKIEEKYFGYHRIGFDISDDFDFGVGEMIIYADRPIDLSYLNPFNFYKSAEHSNRDRDNSLLFIDAKNNSLKGLKIYSMLLIDDITFSKLGTGWYGNETLFQLGVNSENLYGILPLTIQMEYLKVDPYVFTHRLIKNNYTNFGYKLGSFLDPNSELFYSGFNYRINYRLNLSFSISYVIHGANPKNPDGSVKQNVGGDIALGHRKTDSITAHLLDGDLEYLRRYSISLTYQPFKSIFFIVNSSYIHNSLQGSLLEKKFESFVTLKAQF